MGPLKKIKVLDLSRVLAGPFCTMLLSDLGADVIKLEALTGDDARGNAPYVNGESTYFMSLNRGKRSIAMNLKEEASKEIFLRMVKDADVLVENYRPGTMEKLGFSYEVLKEINPRLIYCSISGFGQTGPYKSRPAYDIIVQAMSGIMSITGSADGVPTRVGSSVGDITAGLFSAIAILAALENRHETGKGQFVDIGMLDCMVSILENALVRYFATGVSPKPIGCRHPAATPFDAFKSKDGQIIVAVQNNSLWEKFCKIMGCESLLTQEEFSTNALRTENEAKLKPILQEIFQTKTTQEWIDAFVAGGVPCAPLNKIEDVVKDPHLLHREMVVDVPGHPTVGTFKMPGIPFKYADTKCSIKSAAPVLGQHTDEILKMFDFSADEIKTLHKNNVVFTKE